MTIKREKEKPSYCQETYASHVLNKGDAMQRLDEQWLAICQLEWSPTLADHESLRKAAGEININLIRYSLSMLKSNLQEAAVRDTGRLITELVLDTSEAQESQKRWEAWLDAAPFWSMLAKQNWPEAARQAAWSVVEALTDSGVQLDSAAEAALAEQVGRLEIEDLLPKTTIERLFPATPEQSEW